MPIALTSGAALAAAEGVKGGGDLRQGREDKTSKAKTRQDKTRQNKTRQDKTKADLFKTPLAPLVPSVLTSGAALAAVGVKGWGGLETRPTRKDKQSQNKTRQDKTRSRQNKVGDVPNTNARKKKREDEGSGIS